MLVLFAENIYLQTGLTLRTGTTLGSKLFGTMMILLKDVFENVNQQKIIKTYQHAKGVSFASRVRINVPGSLMPPIYLRAE